MKTLFLLRHAKSSWSNLDLDDIDRPLNKRGRGAADAIAGWMRMQRIRPERILCSSSARTRETLARLMAVLGGEIESEFEDSIYLAGERSLLARVRKVPDDVGSVMLIGHNPGLQHFAMSLMAPDSEPGAMARLAQKYPTGALATFAVGCGSWSDLDRKTGQLRSFILPREL